MKAQAPVMWAGVLLVIVATTTPAVAEPTRALFGEALESSRARENVVFDGYWADEGRWVTEGLLNGELCVSTYELQDGILRLVDREVKAFAPRPVGSRGSDTQRKIFEECAPGVTLIQRNGGLGTGIVLSKDGLVLTNRHVVINSQYVAVSFFELGGDDESPALFRGEVVAADKVRDLALIQVADPPEELRTFELDAELEVKVGDELIAIGHPLGLAWTPTQGTASRVREDFAWDYSLTKNKARVIQFQTPISPGNSGGPLLTKDGKLAGINSFGRSGGQNLNFAVHVSEIADFMANRAAYPAANVHDWVALTEATRAQLPIPDQMRAQQCDFENDSVIDLVRVDQDNNGQWDAMFIDVDRDSRFEFISLDQDEDTYYDVLLLDSNHDGQPDYVFHGNPALRLPVGVEFVAR